MTNSLIEAYDRLQRRVDQDDLHDAIIEVIPRIAIINNPAGYLFRVASRRRHQRLRNATVPLPAQEASPPAGEVADRQSIVATVRLAVGKLPPRERVVVWQHDLNGEDLKTVAGRLSCTPAAIRGLLYRAHRRLRSSLSQMAEGSLEKF